MRPLFAPLFGLALVACPPAPAPADDLAPSPPVETGFPERPTPGAPAVFTPPTPTSAQLPNGIAVHVVSDDSLPLLSVRLVLPTGAVDDPAGKYGLGALGASMLSEGAGERTALEQAAALDGLASKLSFQSGRETLTMALDTHRDRLAEALPLAADALLRPRFDDDDWSRVHDQHLNGLLSAQDNPVRVAGLVSARQFFGADHPYGTPADGTVESAKAVSLADARSWHADNVHAGGAAFVVVGDVKAAEVTALLEQHFGAWEARERPAREFPAAAAGARKIIVDKPGSSQTVVSVLATAPPSTAPGRAALDVGRTIMGGSFTSRMNRRLREELGYTYGARMSVRRMRHGGYISSGASVRGDATADSVAELTALLGAAASEGFTEAEIGRGRAQNLTDIVDSAETRSGLASLYASEIAGGRTPADVASWLKELDSIDAATAKAAASAFDPASSMIVLVGDWSVIEAPLAEKGFEEFEAVGLDGLPLR